MIFDDIKFSFRYKINLKESVPLKTLTINSLNKNYGVDYQGSSYHYVKLAFRNLPVDFSKIRLIDFGSGKGNVILMAQEFGIKEIIGVEFAEELVLLSKQRIKRIKNNNSFSNINIICSDASSFFIPDDSNVFFFYNPFSQNVFEKVLDNIEESLKRHYREIFILYINAVISFDMFLKYGYSEIFKHSSKEKTGILILNK